MMAADALREFRPSPTISLFPTHNCIMASGEREDDELGGSIVPKTCSDDQGSSETILSRGHSG